MPKQRTVGICMSYNGVCMQDCTIEDWEHRVEYDEHHCHKWDSIRITLSSLIVTNAASVTSQTRPVGGNDVNRLHVSQAFYSNPDGNSGEKGFLATDNWLQIEAALKYPRQDFVLWVNNASTDTDSASDEFLKPQEKTARTSPRRILLAACGYPGSEDFVDPSTTQDKYVSIADPAQTTEDMTATNILRRDVLDCQNGPRPVSVGPTPLVGGRSMKVTFTIEICRTIASLVGNRQGRQITDNDNEVALQDLKGDGRRLDPVIYNRWSVVDSEDSEGRITHSIQGKMIVKDPRYKPHSMRLMAFPLAFPYARLMGRRYAVSEDGKTLSYDFQYTHAGAAPPPGVRDYKASYQERFSPSIPGLMQAAMQVQVNGWFHRSTTDPAITVTERTQKIVLLRQAHTILWARIRGAGNKLNAFPGMEATGVRLLDMQVIEAVGVPSLELRVEYAYGDKLSPNDIYLHLQNLGREFYEGQAQAITQYSPLWWPIDNEWGRLTNFDDAHPDYLYGALGNTADWKPYDNYFSIPDTAPFFVGHTAPKLPAISGKPKPYKRETKEGSTVDDGDASGSRPKDTGSLISANYPDTTNPINQKQEFTAIISQSLNGTTVPAVKPPTEIGSTGIYDPNQLSGAYSYISYEAEVLSDGETGKVSLPLSKARELAGGSFSGGSSSKPSEVSTTIRLFAGSGKRVLNVKAERIGSSPTMPQPAEQITRTDSALGGQVVAVENLLHKQIIHDNPQPIRSGQGIVYTTNMKLVYSCSRPWAPDAKQAGYSANELFPLPVNKMLVHDATTQGLNKVDASNAFASDVYT